jgi:hypothetical protein
VLRSRAIIFINFSFSVKFACHQNIFSKAIHLGKGGATMRVHETRSRRVVFTSSHYLTIKFVCKRGLCSNWSEINISTDWFFFYPIEISYAICKPSFFPSFPCANFRLQICCNTSLCCLHRLLLETTLVGMQKCTRFWCKWTRVVRLWRKNAKWKEEIYWRDCWLDCLLLYTECGNRLSNEFNGVVKC